MCFSRGRWDQEVAVTLGFSAASAGNDQLAKSSTTRCHQLRRSSTAVCLFIVIFIRPTWFCVCAFQPEHSQVNAWPLQGKG